MRCIRVKEGNSPCCFLNLDDIKAIAPGENCFIVTARQGRTYELDRIAEVENVIFTLSKYELSLYAGHS